MGASTAANPVNILRLELELFANAMIRKCTIETSAQKIISAYMGNVRYAGLFASRKLTR